MISKQVIICAYVEVQNALSNINFHKCIVILLTMDHRMRFFLEVFSREVVLRIILVFGIKMFEVVLNNILLIIL